MKATNLKILVLTALFGLVLFIILSHINFSSRKYDPPEIPKIYQRPSIAHKKPDINVISLDNDPNELIYAYIPLPIDYFYGSNLIPLTLIALITPPNHAFLELGMGLFSTPLLHRISHDQNRTLVSVDTDLAWISKFLPYNQTRLHRLFHVPNELLRFGLDRTDRWGLVLVDHMMVRDRAQSAIDFANLSLVVVVHDTEAPSDVNYNYSMSKMLESFKYTCKFSLYRGVKREDPNNYISTTVLSNFIDLDKWLKPMMLAVKTDHGHESCDGNY